MSYFKSSEAVTQCDVTKQMHVTPQLSAGREKPHQGSTQHSAANDCPHST